MPIEILAPAGNREALEAAVRSGADAVYLGGKAFGARANAKNFDRDELREAVEYCHGRGVRVHVTVNTLLKDRELPEALEFVRYLCTLPVDAVLVQDMGLLALIREAAPELTVHASTQMSLHTPAGVRLIEELGVKRAVLSRELSLSEIREIRSGSGIELEAFVHGALCMCVSGQCYLSAMLGGRSGNRGQCAQPCRLPFSAAGRPRGDEHALSLRDLSFIGGLPALEEAGVCSAKIEGRMKRPEYVAAATSACRLAADGEAVPQELMERLEAVFSRSGFTDGYLTGRMGPGMFGARRKEDVTAATEKVFGSLRELYRSERQRVPVDLELRQEGQEDPEGPEGSDAVLTARDDEGNTAIARVTCGSSFALSKERILQQLGKTGGTPFYIREARVEKSMQGLNVAGLNALRREALDELLRRRGRREEIAFRDPARPAAGQEESERQGVEPWARAVLRSVEQLCPEALACEELVLPIETPRRELEDISSRYAGRLLLDLPRGMFGQERQLRRLMEERMAVGFSQFLCGNLGALQLCRELGAEAHGSFGLNITNSTALREFARLGLRSAELSWELSGSDARSVSGPIPRGIAVYGRQALMLTRNCPLACASGGCRSCGEGRPGCLTDRKGARFPVTCRSLGKKPGTCGAELLNSVPLWLGDQRLTDFDFMVISLSVENSVECGEILRAIWEKSTPEEPFTRGLFRRGVE